MRRGGDAAREIRLAAAQLYTGGVDLDWQRLHAHDGALRARRCLAMLSSASATGLPRPVPKAGGRSQIGGVGRLLGQPSQCAIPGLRGDPRRRCHAGAGRHG
ncbi:hypothetical protein ACPA9J_27320 [Pseudomonas aeruginosa]